MAKRGWPWWWAFGVGKRESGGSGDQRGREEDCGIDRVRVGVGDGGVKMCDIHLNKSVFFFKNI